VFAFCFGTKNQTFLSEHILRMEIKETDIQRSILDWSKLIDGLNVFRVNVVGIRGRKATNTGMADLIGQYSFAGIPILIWWEVKKPKGKQSETQKDFEKLVKKDGGYYFIVHSIQDAQDALTAIESELQRKISTSFLGRGSSASKGTREYHYGRGTSHPKKPL